MNKNLKVTIFISVIALLAIGVGLFYWYEWRPAQIRKECARIAPTYRTNQRGVSLRRQLSEEEAKLLNEQAYPKCLRERGLNE